ncbi:hypothetical protein Tco_0989065 [Tanacetum coccineum]|uniref:RNA-directed DNA polymerase, eukaryota, reverse transcriptase zinc-binding domain protein n=1 Tax=Tanacetum coccineum TaxID=301880 RepID=A0ABQ5ESN3_9ASTR
MVSILQCFYQASSLKINIHKSKLCGVGVPFEEVSCLAAVMGCSVMQTSFSYLSLPIGCNMDNVKGWDPILDKFTKRLSNWKTSLLSIGGRSTLISSVLGSIGTYYFSPFPMPSKVNNKLESMRSNFFWGSDVNVKKISWISWKSVLAFKDKGGLGIGSLYSLNQALIQKWRWLFFKNPKALWAQVIAAIYGYHQDSSYFFNHVRPQGVWGRIVGSLNTMHEKGIIPHSTLKRTVNNGLFNEILDSNLDWKLFSSTSISSSLRLGLHQDCMIRDCWNNEWYWNWSRPISGGMLANQLQFLESLMNNITLNDVDDVWIWSLGSLHLLLKTLVCILISFIFPMLIMQLDGIGFFQRKLIFSFGEPFVIVSQQGGTLVEEESIWTRFIVRLATRLLKLYTTLCGFALLLPQFGIVFLLCWTYRFPIHHTSTISSVGLMTCGSRLLRKLFWKLFVESFFSPYGISRMRRFLETISLVATFCLIRLLIVLIGGIQIETSVSWNNWFENPLMASIL